MEAVFALIGCGNFFIWVHLTLGILRTLQAVSHTFQEFWGGFPWFMFQGFATEVYGPYNKQQQMLNYIVGPRVLNMTTKRKYLIS